MLSLMLENGWHASLPLKVFDTESRGKILIRGGCNTLGVSHMLSNGFVLKHDRISGDGGVKVKSMKMSPNLILDNTPLLTCWPFSNVYLSNVEGASFMCLISISTQTDNWKSFIKFRIKNSHEMTNYVLVWIALSSKWKHVMSTKPCNLAQIALIKLMNKSYERFMLSKCQENASMDQKA